MLRILRTAAVICTLAPLAGPAAFAASGDYHVTNLVADQPGAAPNTDRLLVNAWGLAAAPVGPWWTANNGSGTSSLLLGNGAAFAPIARYVVKIPAPGGGYASAPTGIVANTGGGFAVSNGKRSASSQFLFATEDGTISGWNMALDLTHAFITVDHAADGAVYKGLAIAESGGRKYVYAANFRAAKVAMYDESFALVKTFGDPALPPGYAPFGIQALGGKLYVSFALQDAAKHDDTAGAGHGFVDVFAPDGTLERSLISRGVLNSPWGLALAPAGFGRFGGALLVGNFGDGRINAFDPASGTLLGTLADGRSGSPLIIYGLWGLAFGNGNLAGPRDRLYFTAGPGDEQHGLFGVIRAVR